MKTLGYYNGKYDEMDNMMVPMNDRACYFGDGVYEATLVRNYVIFCLDEHIDRLYNSAAMVQIDIPMSKEEFKALLNEMVQKLDDGNQMLYWQITRGTAMRKHCFPEDVKANVWITIKPMEVKNLEVPIKLMDVEDTRFLHCNVKTLNLLPNVMANQAAARAGCQEAVFHRGERVTEGSHSNIHILKKGTLKTAPLDHFILPGIARAHLIAMCKTLGVPVDETPFTMEEMKDADEILITSSTQILKRASELNGQPVGGKDTALFDKLLENLVKEYYSCTDK